MAWNFNLTTVNFLDFQTAADEIEAAIIERAKAMNDPSLFAVIPARNKLEPTRANAWSRWAYDSINALWATGFADNIFINYTDSSGNWNDISTIAPQWTSGTLLVKIGEASFFNPNVPSFNQNLQYWGEFISQSYKILNELIWLRCDGEITIANRERKTYNGADGESYASAQTNFNAVAFSGGGAAASSSSEWDVGDNAYTIRRVFNTVENDNLTNSDLLTFDFDIYNIFINGPNTGDVYNNPDFTVSVNNYGLSNSGTDSTQTASATVGNINNSNQPDPEPLPGDTSRYIWTIDAIEAYMIQKYDVVGGFVYV